MKNLFFIVMVVLTITITSCSNVEVREYTYAEMMTLVAIEKAFVTPNELPVYDSNGNIFSLPIIKIDDVGYFPYNSEDKSIKYCPVQ